MLTDVVANEANEANDANETGVLESARCTYPDLSYDDCTSGVLADIAGRHGVDFATALFFDRIRRVPRNRELATALERADPSERPLRALGKLVIVPALFYREHPGVGGDGAVGGSARANAEILCDLMPRLCSDPTVIVSLSKGGADLRLAFEAMGRPPAGLRAWVNVSGLLRGTPAIDRLLERWWRRWLLRMIMLRGGASPDLPREFATDPSSPLHRAATAPPGLLVINLLGFPLASHILTSFGRLRHRQMAAYGPNDGLGLLRDAIVEPGLTYPVWGADHYFRVPAVPILLRRVIAYLVHEGRLVPASADADAGHSAGRIR
jgi:hypothetical protein